VNTNTDPFPLFDEGEGGISNSASCVGRIVVTYLENSQLQTLKRFFMTNKRTYGQDKAVIHACRFASLPCSKPKAGRPKKSRGLG
jgi:hypothetical protein